MDWLSQKVGGLQDRRDARNYASNLLKAGYIRHTVNKTKFSEQCYYIFGEYNGTPIHKGMFDYFYPTEYFVKSNLFAVRYS